MQLGLLPKPEIRNPGQGGGGARQLGYFPDQALDRVRTIQRLKREGIAMADIVNQLRIAESAVDATPPPEAPSLARAGPRPVPAPTLSVTVDDLPHPAYMINYNFELVWFNEAARLELLGGFAALPPTSDGRNLLNFICRSPEFAARNDEFLRFHAEIAKQRLSEAAFAKACRDLPSASTHLLRALFAEAPGPTKRAITDAAVSLKEDNGASRSYQAYASFYREGVLFVFAPMESDIDSLLRFLARRDDVIRGLLRKQLPVLTPLAVLVADLQNSVRICSELPPEEYFELVNEIWGAMEPIFSKYYGTHGKHVGDGMVYYFFPQADSNYSFNALLCAQELRGEMRRISKAWQLRKNWLNELYLNIGINEGEEWLGTFQSATAIEFTALGDTINRAGRLSDFARHGKIWATKSLMGKLNPQQRARVRYGITRRAEDGHEVFISSSFSLLSGIVDISEGRFEKFRDLAALPVAEIVEVAPAG